jgi:hypothetical protein
MLVCRFGGTILIRLVEAVSGEPQAPNERMDTTDRILAPGEIEQYPTERRFIGCNTELDNKFEYRAKY